MSEYCEFCGVKKTPKTYPSGQKEHVSKMLARRTCDSEPCREKLAENKNPMTFGFDEPPRPPDEIYIDRFNRGCYPLIDILV